MKKLVLLIALMMLSTPAFADISVSVTNAWVRATINRLPTTAAYLDIKNNGKQPVNLMAASSPVGTASLHESMEQGGMMHMQPLASVKIAPGETVSFAPGHKHIMLEDLKSSLKQGDKIKLTLKFKEGSTTVDIPVSAKGAPDKMKMEHQ